MRRTLSFTLAFVVSGVLFAQDAKINIDPLTPGIDRVENAGTPSGLLQSPRFGEVAPVSDSPKRWGIHMESRQEKEHDMPGLEALKHEKFLQKQASLPQITEQDKSTNAVTPVVGSNFEGNWSVNLTPPDNSLAISNGGKIVSANNDGIEYYTTSGSWTYSAYWSDFFNDGSLTATLYDPKVIYDAGSDRFFLVVLHGSSAATSKVIVSVSKTNDPAAGWWVYQLTGNPLSNSCWFDYPNLGVSNNEIYVTGNLYDNSDNYNQSIIYQISKSGILSGGTINWQYWYNLNTSGIGAFTPVPASHGQGGAYGPGCYFVNTQYSSGNQVRLWDLTDDLGGSPQLNVYNISTTPYSVAAAANMQGSSETLDNGDCRVKAAFYMGGKIAFVFHSDAGSGWNGINFNVMNVGAQTNSSTLFGASGTYDYCYPSLASFSSSTSDMSSVIVFLRSSSSSYPGIRVVTVDNALGWSSDVNVKAGESVVDFLSGNERWGDYTGACRRYSGSTSPQAWVSGCYGADIPSMSTYDTYKTWIAQITPGGSSGVEIPFSEQSLTVYPNPVYDFYTLAFQLETTMPIDITLIDENGRLVRTLFSDEMSSGAHTLYFNKGALTPGVYFVKLSTGTTLLQYEKVLIVH